MRSSLRRRGCCLKQGQRWRGSSPVSSLRGSPRSSRRSSPISSRISSRISSPISSRRSRTRSSRSRSRSRNQHRRQALWRGRPQQHHHRHHQPHQAQHQHPQHGAHPRRAPDAPAQHRRLRTAAQQHPAFVDAGFDGRGEQINRHRRAPGVPAVGAHHAQRAVGGRTRQRLASPRGKTRHLARGQRVYEVFTEVGLQRAWLRGGRGGIRRSRVKERKARSRRSFLLACAGQRTFAQRATAWATFATWPRRHRGGLIGGISGGTNAGISVGITSKPRADKRQGHVTHGMHLRDRDAARQRVAVVPGHHAGGHGGQAQVIHIDG